MRILVSISVLLNHVAAFAQHYAPRAEYHQNLEPNGTIQHGAGQDPGAFRLYDGAMDEGEEPMTFMYYRNLTNTGTNWHIQLEQPLTVEEGHRYAIAYQAKSNVETTMETWLQQSTSPFAGYAMQTVSLSPGAATFYDTAFVTVDDDVLLRFMLGVSGLAEIWVDNVSLVDLDPIPTGATNEMPVYSKLELTDPYPNPFTGSVNIEFETTQSGPVRIEIYNMLGQVVATLADGHRGAGSHKVQWADNTARSGVYLVRLLHSSQATTRTIVLQK